LKIKLDENIPTSLVSILSGLGHDVDTVVSEGLKGRDDETVREAARADNRFLITQDLDFSDQRQFASTDATGVMLVRLHTPGREELADRVKFAFAEGDLNAWHRSLVVVGDRKIRVRKI
jgi:predicted nuclease of predicted toxin-antitoxin system